MKTVGIIGGTGYTGGELLRLVLNHPTLTLKYAVSRSQAGKKIGEVHADLFGWTDLTFTDHFDPEVDVLFLCLGHGLSKTFMEEKPVSEETIVIDLSQDFRLASTHNFNHRQFVYGLPEFQKEAIENSRSIANPGCFATALQLALLPLAADQKMNTDVHINATTGSTGAGIKTSATGHFSWRNNNLSWYKPFNHQHLNEIGETLSSLQQSKPRLHFLPHRGDFTRGIFATAYIKTDLALTYFTHLFDDYYASHPFTQRVLQPIHLKQVVNTNMAHVHLHKHEDVLLITSAIDNLLKGAAGQALQNLNIILGLEETLGLQLKASIF
ncbi:MAG: N-acetyl-gamma-glutamyl-phosphate reductase [Flavobacteriaceae bacterium]